MSALLLVVVVITAAALLGGVFLTFRAFRALDHPRISVNPAIVRGSHHDAATTAQLRHFFEGKACAACGRSIQPMHAGDLRPGLLNPATHEAMAWNDIPPANLSTTLASHAPICSNCLLLETFRRQHPELIVDRHRAFGSDRPA
jgi:hypothetical protein